ncbi:MAG: hypothetical protein ACK53L_04370, partial [Pirellulaceae bacterium]
GSSTEEEQEKDGHYVYQRIQDQMNAEVRNSRKNSRIDSEILGHLLEKCELLPAMYVGIAPKGEDEKRIARNLIHTGFTTHKAIQQELNKEIQQKVKIRMLRATDELRPQFETEEDAVHRIFVDYILPIKPSDEKTEEEKRKFRIQVWEGFN